MNTQNPVQQNNHLSQLPLIDDIATVISNPQIPLSKEKLMAAGVSEQTADNLIFIENAVNAYQNSQNAEIQRQQILLSDHQTEMRKKQSDLTLNSLTETFDTISEIKTGLKHSIRSSRRIQAMAAIMYLATFLMGFLLVGAGAYLTGVEGKTDWFTAAFGASGFVLILATFVANPPRELQRVRSNYVQLSMLALGWLNEVLDNSGFRFAVTTAMDLDTTQKVDRQKELVELQNLTTEKYLLMMENHAEPKEEKDHGYLLKLNEQTSALKEKVAEATTKK
ncbi:MAG: hypothetical protein SF052_03755 [Bacteroidia bacterium]|nr:hypothetical protein [Bacteroidia bacterium]